MTNEVKNFFKELIIFLAGLLVGVFLSIQIFKQSNISNIFDQTLNDFTTNHTVFPTVAVTSNGEGVLEYGVLKIMPGNGKVYLGINPFVEADTQYSIETAKRYVCNLLNVDCSKYDFTVDILSNATLVGGPSAGLAFAIAFYCLLQGKNVSNQIAATGTIDTNGNIGPIGGVFEKALAAAENNKKIFFLPKGQSVVYTYDKVEKRREIYPGFYYMEIEYVPKQINLTQIFLEKYNMQIVEVSNFKEILNYNICG
ncbi:hypothetical protein BA065_00005 [Nanoarchaeota archaeon NZ13-N]|uniref:Lon proteolytic domain-containing protein n=1 Tax=Candidatus Nanoclepta minutus TaxID=1940235 RepID=A0A397WNC4_9ARCH|nr:MAG: hypothetical protein BA065_00005 [Nanoarchaeota archaeon NZ13-N]RIB35570.1 MAG: hypothetical protein BXU00_00475 [Candidatus Nanoclepta minutus]